MAIELKLRILVIPNGGNRRYIGMIDQTMVSMPPGQRFGIVWDRDINDREADWSALINTILTM